MDRITGTLAALALGVGVSLALAGGAVAQPQGGCEIIVDPASETAGIQGSEEYAEIAPTTGAETAGETPDPEMGAEAEAVGSESAARIGMGECDEIEQLSIQKKEG